jgi:threonine dehydrogenase-like Zn-dependent dehydrogenase
VHKKIKAAVATGVGQIEVREYPYPSEVLKGGAIIKNLATGICGTDKHTYQGHLKHRAGMKNEFDVEYPLVQGHETVGIIEEIDQGVTDYYGEPLKVGDRVVCAPDVVCGKCYYCRMMSWYPWCESLDFHNIGESHNADIYPHVFGGFSEYMNVWPRTSMFKVPEGLSDDLAAFTEVMAVAYTLDKAKEFFAFDGEGFSFGGTVVVQGCGPIGLAHIIKARMMGAGKIIATDLSDYKLAIAQEFGADVLINAQNTTQEERVQLVKDETKGRGAEVIVDCAGVPQVVPEGIEMAGVAGIYLDPGQFVAVGEIPIDVNKIVAKSLRIVGMSNHALPGYVPTMEMMLRYQDAYPWEKLFSHRFALDDYEEAMKVSMAEDSMKVLVYPWGLK